MYTYNMYLCMVIHAARVWIKRERLPMLLVVSWTTKINISLSPFAPENLVSRYEFGSPVPSNAYKTVVGSTLNTVLYVSSAHSVE